ncbi:MAG: transposase, partial [Burkholderiales bacterium]|nr:transposase [Burkholderiales bacterium]
MHGAELKTAVIAACREPGVSVAAVAQAHGLNANLVRKWLVGRGIKRCGLDATSSPGLPLITNAAPAMPFVPVQLPAPTRA